MKTQNRAAALLGVGVLAVTALAACGDDRDDSDGSPNSGGAAGDDASDGGAGGGELAACHPINLDVSLCDPAAATFSLASTNPYYPLVVGLIVELAGAGEGDEAGIDVTVTREVLEETRTIMGVETHVLSHETKFDGVLHEVALNFYVEATDGTVCYFGEDVEFYDDMGTFANTDGTWKAGKNGALPGVIMPAKPKLGDAYYQEYAPGIALDMGKITSVDLATVIAEQSYDTIQIMDTNPIDSEDTCEEEEKRYARGIGEIKDTVLELVSFTPGNGRQSR
jgi:hypothetical protein